MAKRCPRCGSMMPSGIRWSRTQRKVKIYYYCSYCNLIFYREHLKEKNNKCKK